MIKIIKWNLTLQLECTAASSKQRAIHFPSSYLVCFNSVKSFLHACTSQILLSLTECANKQDDEALSNEIYAKYKHLLSSFPTQHTDIYMPLHNLRLFLATREHAMSERWELSFQVVHYCISRSILNASFPYCCSSLLFIFFV